MTLRVNGPMSSVSVSRICFVLSNIVHSKILSELEVTAMNDGQRRHTKLHQAFNEVRWPIGPRELSCIIQDLSLKELIEIGAWRTPYFMTEHIRKTIHELCDRHPEARFVTLPMKLELPYWLGEERMRLTPLARKAVAQPKISMLARARLMFSREPKAMPSIALTRPPALPVAPPKPDDLAA